MTNFVLVKFTANSKTHSFESFDQSTSIVVVYWHLHSFKILTLLHLPTCPFYKFSLQLVKRASQDAHLNCPHVPFKLAFDSESQFFLLATGQWTAPKVSVPLVKDR